MKTTKVAVMLLLSLFFVAPASWADNQSANSATPDLDCLDGPKICRERAAKKKALHQQCVAYPEWCQLWYNNQVETRKERRALREACRIDPNPNKCEHLKWQFKGKKAQRRKKERQKLKEIQRQWCNKNPDACKQWKAEQKKVRQQCQQLHRQLAKKYPSRPKQH